MWCLGATIVAAERAAPVEDSDTLEVRRPSLREEYRVSTAYFYYFHTNFSPNKSLNIHSSFEKKKLKWRWILNNYNQMALCLKQLGKW